MASLRRSLFRALTRSPPIAPFRTSSVSRFSTVHVNLSDEEGKRRLFNRLLYRSRQRGFLELDLVLGNWVEENIRSLDELRIRALVDVLDLLGISLTSPLMQIPIRKPRLVEMAYWPGTPPEAVSNNPVFSAVRAKVINNLNKAAPESRAAPGQPWVRGWDDKGGKLDPCMVTSDLKFISKYETNKASSFLAYEGKKWLHPHD